MDEQARQPPAYVSGLDLRGALKELTEHDLRL